MRTLFLSAILLACPLFAAECTVQVEAPGHAGETVHLLRYDDLFTLRTVHLDRAVLDATGKATLHAEVEGITKGILRIGDLKGDIYLTPGGNYRIVFGEPMPRTARTISGNTSVPLQFMDIDPLDINALVSDLNARLDAFMAEDLATDREAGMRAADVRRRNPPENGRDSLRRPPTIFVTPNAPRERIDTLEARLKQFYAEVSDPWFMRYMDLAIGGMHIGPRTLRKELFERYLAGKEAAYDDPEYVRFVRNLFEDHLIAEPFRRSEPRLKRAIHRASIDSLDVLLRDNDLLASDDLLRELVMIDQLYLQYHGKLFDRDGMLAMLREVAERSTTPIHRHIATNMVWDLTAMRPGAMMPTLRLADTLGGEVLLDSLLEGATCVAFTASWCTYCETELAGLAQLTEEYGSYLEFIIISMDADHAAMEQHRKPYPSEWTWLHAGDDPELMDELRLRSLPVFLLLNDRTLARAPAEPPSRGLGSFLHRIKTMAEKDRGRYDPERGAPTPAPR